MTPERPATINFRGRAIKHMVVFALLGVVMNYLVAWGILCVQSVEIVSPVEGVSALSNAQGLWIVGRTTTLGLDTAFSRLEHGYGADLRTYPLRSEKSAEEAIPSWAGWTTPPEGSRRLAQGILDETFGDSEIIFRGGLPFRSLTMSEYQTFSTTAYAGSPPRDPSARGLLESTTSGGWDLGWHSPGVFTLPDNLPWRPLWLGLLFNSVFYALLIPLCLRGVRGVRKVMRERARQRIGACPNCGYDLRGHVHADSLCPECGGRSP